MRATHLISLFDLLHALAFCPADRRDTMWDTWLFRRADGSWLLNYLVAHNASTPPRFPFPAFPDGWNGVSSALSSDGAHFADLGVAFLKDCADPIHDCAVWLGSGSVWRRQTAGGAGDDIEELIMNYSQDGYDCAGGASCQSIFFATSTDGLSWVPVAPDAQAKGGIVFKYNQSWYVEGGRWDCIAVLPRHGGGYYGYWTATPQPSSELCGTHSCGAGFGVSDDGLHWRALPTPGPAVHGEVGGVATLAGRVWMTFAAGHLYEARTPMGPFVPAKRNARFLTQEGHAYFPRLWGALYTGSANLTLVTHQQKAGVAVYAGLVKRAVFDDDAGVLRAHWWSANDVLKGAPLPLRPARSLPALPPSNLLPPALHPPPLASLLSASFTRHHSPDANFYSVTALVNQTTPLLWMKTPCESPDCLSSGMWLEGSLSEAARPAGIWLEQASGGGFAFALDVQTAEGTTAFLIGRMTSPEQGWLEPPVRIDRHLRMQPGTPMPWRAVVRNAWSGYAMVEFYVDDVLSLPYTLDGLLTGTFVAFNGSVAAVSRLTLPTQTPIPPRDGSII